MLETTIEPQNIWVGLLLTLAAGLCMCLGAGISMCMRAGNRKLDTFILGFSGGLMATLCFFDLLPESFEHLMSEFGVWRGGICALGSFVVGVLMLSVIDFIIPCSHSHSDNMQTMQKHDRQHLLRAGIMLAVFIGIHNFPEGMAMFAASLEGWNVAIPIFIGVALHNIPEGMAIYGPIRISTGNRRKAFLYTFGSAMMQPLGAVAALTILLPIWTPTVNAVTMAVVAGMMLYICYDELLPGANVASGPSRHHHALAGTFCGIILMLLTLIFAHHHAL